MLHQAGLGSYADKLHKRINRAAEKADTDSRGQAIYKTDPLSIGPDGAGRNPKAE